MLLQRSIRTGSSIFAHYRATGRSFAHGLCLLKRREKRRCSFSTQSSKLVYPAAHVTIGEHDTTLSQQILDVPRQELLIFSSSGRNSPVGFARTHEGAWARNRAPTGGLSRRYELVFSRSGCQWAPVLCPRGEKSQKPHAKVAADSHPQVPFGFTERFRKASRESDHAQQFDQFSMSVLSREISLFNL